MRNLNLVARTAMSNSSVSVLEAEGVLDINTADVFEAALVDFFRKKQFKIILNFAKLNYISSAGIGIVVGSLKQVRQNRGDIKISNVSPEIYKVFDLLELPRILQLYTTEVEAAAKF